MDNAKTLATMWRYPEAAKFLGITTDSLRRKVMLRQVPCYRPFGEGGRVLFDSGELAELVRDSRVTPVSEIAARQGGRRT